jgi:hypothetical protein
MKPQTVTVSSATTSAWIPVDHRKNPFNIGFGVVVSGGGVLTYKVQYSFDEDGTTAFDHDDVTGETASQVGNFAFPVRLVRLNVTAFTSGTATLTMIQAG